MKTLDVFELTQRTEKPTIEDVVIFQKLALVGRINNAQRIGDCWGRVFSIASLYNKSEEAASTQIMCRFSWR